MRLAVGLSDSAAGVTRPSTADGFCRALMTLLDYQHDGTQFVANCRVMPAREIFYYEHLQSCYFDKVDDVHVCVQILSYSFDFYLEF